MHALQDAKYHLQGTYIPIKGDEIKTCGQINRQQGKIQQCTI